MLTPEELLTGYARGIFPMADSREDPKAKWYTAERRGIIPLDNFRVSSNVRRIIRNEHYRVQYDHAFREVIEACADRESTWISDEIIASYRRLHEMGHAHSVSVYDGLKLVGGQYGVSLGAAFFGESMFERAKEASKVALWHCHQALVQGGFELWDTQFWNEHLAQFGCVEISAGEYRERLRKAIRREAEFREPDTLPVPE